MKKYILTLDEGTTSARAIVFDNKGNIASLAQHEFTQIYPSPGYVEHNPLEIFSSQYTAMSEAIINGNINLQEIAAIGITNQRETTVVWDKITGEPVYNAIVWQCRRTTELCEKIVNDGYADYIAEKTGLKVDAYFSATKIYWILNNVQGAMEKAKKGELLFGTVDTWLLWKLSGGKIHATDYTNASRTMLFDIHNLCWDKKLLEIFGIPESMLPAVYPSGNNFGKINVMGEEIPVCSIAGDQQSALFGQCCFDKGELKNTYGTGCFLLMNTGEKAFKSSNGLVTTLAATLNGEKPQYVLEGSVFVGGAEIQWLRDELKILKTATESEEMANKTTDNGGVYIVPAFSGLGAPYWDMRARGTICGLTRGSGRNEIVRAALEAIAYQSEDLLNSMRADTGIDLKALKADGGACKNKFLMQFQADISDLDVVCPTSPEATALGAAYLAGIVCGFLSGRDELKGLSDTENVYSSNMDKTEREDLLDGWHTAVLAAQTFSNRRKI
ncbi:MAG: glycerol kinase GlpK [Clostridia bacterium]|nr:glycerol kinase GlpK [Clostridia bacterium]